MGRFRRLFLWGTAHLFGCFESTHQSWCPHHFFFVNLKLLKNLRLNLSQFIISSSLKNFFAFFLSHCHTYCESVSYAWQEGFSPVTLPSQGYVCVIGAWQEKYASVTPNWLILRLCDGVIGKSRKKYFFSHGDFF